MLPLCSLLLHGAKTRNRLHNMHKNWYLLYLINERNFSSQFHQKWILHMETPSSMYTSVLWYTSCFSCICKGKIFRWPPPPHSPRLFQSFFSTNRIIRPKNRRNKSCEILVFSNVTKTVISINAYLYIYYVLTS